MEKFVGIGGKSLCPVLYLSSCFEILSCSSHLKCNQYFSHLFLFFPLLTFHSTCTTETVLPLTPYSTNEVLNFRKTAGPRPFTPPLSECRTFELGEAPSLSLSHALPGAPPILPLLSLYVEVVSPQPHQLLTQILLHIVLAALCHTPPQPPLPRPPLGTFPAPSSCQTLVTPVTEERILEATGKRYHKMTETKRGGQVAVGL